MGRTDLLVTRCCCCVPKENIDKTIKEIEAGKLSPISDRNKSNEVGNYVALGGNEEEMDELPQRRPTFLKQKSNILHNPESGKLGVLFDKKGHALPDDLDENPDNIRIAPGAIPD